MKIIEQSVKFKFEPESSDNILKKLEDVARTCYASNNLIKDGSAKKLIKKILISKHESILEHYSFTFEIETNRKIANQLVRHRTGKYAQRSLRYVNEIKKESNLRFILSHEEDKEYFEKYLSLVEEAYIDVLESHGTEVAGQILPLCTATKIDFTIDLRNLRHFLDLRCSEHTEPLMRELAISILNLCYNSVDVIFDDLYEKYI